MPCTLPASLADAAVCRGSFHAVLGGEAGEAVFADFSAALQKAQAEGLHIGRKSRVRHSFDVALPRSAVA